jgi:membrane protein YdbS with pleckstrin-like domain
MSDEFAVDESGMTSDGYHRLQPTCKKAMYVRNVIAMAVLILIGAAILIFMKPQLGEWYDTALYLILGLLIVIAVYFILGPQIFFMRYRYRIDDEKAEIRRGVLVITHTLVPIERIHQVQVAKGPINRMFGLADVNITTAGGTAVLEYLDIETAESVASKLNECVVSLLKDRD